MRCSRDLAGLTHKNFPGRLPFLPSSQGRIGGELPSRDSLPRTWYLRMVPAEIQPSTNVLTSKLQTLHTWSLVPVNNLTPFIALLITSCLECLHLKERLRVLLTPSLYTLDAGPREMLFSQAKPIHARLPTLTLYRDVLLKVPQLANQSPVWQHQEAGPGGRSLGHRASGSN